MKKYFNYISIAIVVTILTVGSFSVVLPVSAQGTDCVPGKVIDTETGLPCSVIAVCGVGVLINHLTGAPCGTSLSSSVSKEDSLDNISLIKVGDKNKAIVADIQEALDALGYQVKADGVFGPKTKAVVRTFQSDKYLSADGVLGKRTFDALQKELDKKSIPIPIVRNVNKELERENAAFVTYARSVIDMNDSSTWGTLISNNKGSKWYKREFTGFRLGVDGKPKYYIIHAHE